jgi:hypothetical protein
VSAREAADVEVDQLRRTITKLTGRTCMSRDLRYLRDRVSDLTRRKAAGEDVRQRLAIRRSPLSIYLADAANTALMSMTERAKLGASALVREALREYADSRGWTREAAAFAPEVP